MPMVFSGEGYSVSKATNSADLLFIVAKHRFDVIIIEHHLPDNNGLYTLSKLRATNSTPVIFLTGHAEMVDRIIGLELGADDYIPKPFHLRDLLARVNSVMRRSGIPALNSRI
jgi:DNA-binding response OmpR family regulator